MLFRERSWLCIAWIEETTNESQKSKLVSQENTYMGHSFPGSRLIAKWQLLIYGACATFPLHLAERPRHGAWPSLPDVEKAEID